MSAIKLCLRPNLKAIRASSKTSILLYIGDVRTGVDNPLGSAQLYVSNFPEQQSAPSLTFFGNASPVHTHRRMTLIISAASPFPVRDIMDPHQLRTLFSESAMPSGNPGVSSPNPVRNAPLISRAPSGCLPVTANTASAAAHQVILIRCTRIHGGHRSGCRKVSNRTPQACSSHFPGTGFTRKRSSSYDCIRVTRISGGPGSGCRRVADRPSRERSIWGTRTRGVSGYGCHGVDDLGNAT